MSDLSEYTGPGNISKPAPQIHLRGSDLSKLIYYRSNGKGKQTQYLFVPLQQVIVSHVKELGQLFLQVLSLNWLLSHCFTAHSVNPAQPLPPTYTTGAVGGLLYLLNVLHAIQEFGGDWVQLQQIHAIEGALQQLKDGRQLKWSSGFRQKKGGLPRHSTTMRKIGPSQLWVCGYELNEGLYPSLNVIKRDIHASSDPRLSGPWSMWRMERRTLHLDILFSGFPKFFQPELSLARVDRWRRRDAGALALGSRCDGLHGVEVLRCDAAFFYPPTGAPAQGSDNTFTPTVRAFREGFHFVIITQQLRREEDECSFHRAQQETFEFQWMLKCP